MFGLRFFATRARSLTLGLAAAALAVTTLAAPATPASAQLENAGKLAVSDIAVTRKSVQPSGNGWVATFEVRNPSIHTVQVKTSYYAILYRSGQFSRYAPFVTDAPLQLGPGQTAPVTITCTPHVGEYCEAFAIKAAYALDPHDGNNGRAYNWNDASQTWQ